MAETGSDLATAYVDGPPAPFALPVLNAPSAAVCTQAWARWGGFLLHSVVPPDVCDQLVQALNTRIVAADAADRSAPWPTGFADRLIASGSAVMPFWDPTVAAALPLRSARGSM